MKLWIVDHEHGVALVAARDARQAAFIADCDGSPLAVYPYRGPLLLELGRERAERDEDDEPGAVHYQMTVDFGDDGVTEESLFAAIDRNNVSFDQEEYERRGPSRSPEPRTEAASDAAVRGAIDDFWAGKDPFDPSP